MSEAAPAQAPRTLVLMGPSGAGKSTVGARAAKLAHVPFFEGDAFHPPSNVEKIRGGGSLSNEDRMPWIAAIGRGIADAAPPKALLACSALNQDIRDALRAALPGPCAFALLVVPADELRRRLEARKDHFAGPALLESQIAAMDDAVGVVRLDGTQPIGRVAHHAAQLVKTL